MPNRIAELRKARGLTLKQLGDAVGLKDNTISQYETGKREPKLETWRKLADALNVSVPYLQGMIDTDFLTDIKPVSNSQLSKMIQRLQQTPNMSASVASSIAILVERLLDIEKYSGGNLDMLLLVTVMDMANFIEEDRHGDVLSEQDMQNEIMSLLTAIRDISRKSTK